MRLSNNMRDAFVRAALDDVPKVDYSEMMRVMVQKEGIAQLPPKIRALHNDPALRHFVATSKKYLGGQYVYVAGPEFEPSEKLKADIKDLSAVSDAQDTKLHELRTKLRACAYACSTRKALLDMLPEFEKYLPADDVAASRSLPVVANVVADFVKAGWPAGTKKPKTAKVIKNG